MSDKKHKKKAGGKKAVKSSKKHSETGSRKDPKKGAKPHKGPKAERGRSKKGAGAAAAPLSKKERKELLKGHHCTGCKKHCPLNDPKCKKGRAQADAFLESLLGSFLKSK